MHMTTKMATALGSETGLESKVSDTSHGDEDKGNRRHDDQETEEHEQTEGGGPDTDEKKNNQDYHRRPHGRGQDPGLHADEHTHGGENHHGGGKMMFYCCPSQRQRWGEPQSLPHTDWNATFMDLFYVAAAYNLGTLIRSDTSTTGILYFAGLFYPIMMVWNTKMHYDSRFCIAHDDMFHKLYEFAVLIALGTSVLYIRPVHILQSPDNVDLFVYTLCTTICHTLAIGRIIEVLFHVDGQPAAKTCAKRDLKYYALSFIFFIAATIVSGIATQASNDYVAVVEGKYNSSEYSSSSSSYDDYKNEVTHNKDRHQDRELAGLATSTTYDDYGNSFNARQQDITVWLLLAGSISFEVMVGLLVLSLPPGGKHKEISVPMNIDFCIHRYGAWVMLMLGESVLSLLIVVAPETSEYYETFFSGVISITLLEYLHFRSQPYDADDHAMRRAKEAGVLFGYLMFIYSAALVVLGTCYKMLLYELNYSSDFVPEDNYDNSNHRRSRSLLVAVLDRVLAGGGDIGGDSSVEVDDRRQRIANMFSGSMAIVFLCSDLMILTHRGIVSNYRSCKDKHKPFAVHVLAVILLLIRVGMIGFTASLSQWITEPSTLSMIGMCAILFQVLLRVVGTALYGPVFKSSDGDDSAGSKGGIGEMETNDVWPNVTRPMVEYTANPDDVNEDK